MIGAVAGSREGRGDTSAAGPTIKVDPGRLSSSV
jgi:hypothetical protein